MILSFSVNLCVSRNQFIILDIKSIVTHLHLHTHTKMASITSLLVLMKYFALLPDEHVKIIRLRELILIFMCSLPILFVLIPKIVYLMMFHDTEDVIGFTDLIYTIFMFFGVWCGYLIIASRQIRIRNLLFDLKVIVSNSEY